MVRGDRKCALEVSGKGRETEMRYTMLKTLKDFKQLYEQSGL